MTSSASSSNTAVAIVPVHVRGTLCDCPEPLPVKQQESWKAENPARRFFNCTRSLISDNSCHYFRWIDPPLNQHYKDTIWRLRQCIESFVSMNINYEIGRLENKLLKEKALRESKKEMPLKKVVELEYEKDMTLQHLSEMQVDKEQSGKKIGELEVVIRKLKTKVKMMSVFLAMLVLVVAWFVMFIQG